MLYKNNGISQHKLGDFSVDISCASDRFSNHVLN